VGMPEEDGARWRECLRKLGLRGNLRTAAMFVEGLRKMARGRQPCLWKAGGRWLGVSV